MYYTNKKSPIFKCDETMCEFVNSDALYMSDDERNVCDLCTIDGIDGSVIVIDFYDADAMETFCEYEIFQSVGGDFYALDYAYVDYDECDNPYISDGMISNDIVLASVTPKCDNMQFWHAIYECVQQMP